MNSASRPGLASARFDGPVAVIGDVHGCRALLAKLLEELGACTLVVLGDVGDHGPDTRGVLDLLIGRRAMGVRGNHEEWLTAWAAGQGFDSFALNPMMGGRATLDSYGVVGTTPREIEAEAWRVPEAHKQWLLDLPLALDLEVAGERYWVIHAGVPPVDDDFAVSAEDIVPLLVREPGQRLVWSPTRPELVPWCGRPVIMGHTVVPAPVVRETVVALDTGAGVLGDRGRLSAVVLPGRQLVSVGH